MPCRAFGDSHLDLPIVAVHIPSIVRRSSSTTRGHPYKLTRRKMNENVDRKMNIEQIWCVFYSHYTDILLREFLMLTISTRTSWFHYFTYIFKCCFIFSCCLHFIFVLFAVFYCAALCVINWLIDWFINCTNNIPVGCTARSSFFTERVINIYNSLSVDTDFSSLNRFHSTGKRDGFSRV